MKIKQLLLSLLTLSVFLVSCSKENILGSDIAPINNMEHATMSTSSVDGTQTSLKAYIFVEPKSKHPMIKNYLKTLPFTGRLPFVGFHGVGLGENLKSNFPNFSNYINMPHWIDGRLPQIMQVDIPQTSGGIDTFGYPVQAFNFNTAKITKNTVNDRFSWIIVLVPINAMNNDTKRQRRIHIVERAGNITRSSRVYTTDNVLSGAVINYNGNRIPAGRYRIYSTTDRGMVLNLNSTNDVYIRGFSNQ
jgi:hypothetical protein